MLKAILALRQKGLFAGALIKKRCYWPTLVPGDKMDVYFASKNVGDVNAIQGQKDGIDYTFWGMKEPDYVMRIMATGGALISDDSCKVAHHGTGANKKSFRYTRPFE